MARPSTREKLLDCAEALFGDHGLEGVSLRAINTAAGLSPAALHYHFGTKAALLEALLMRHMPELMERRKKLLDDLGQAAEPPTTREILSALVQPLAELLAREDEAGARYLRLINRLHADGDLDPGFVIERWPGGVDRLVPLLRKANPALPRPLVEFRLGLVLDVMLRNLSHGAPPSGGDLSLHISSLLDFLTGGFEEPLTGGSIE